MTTRSFDEMDLVDFDETSTITSASTASSASTATRRRKRQRRSKQIERKIEGINDFRRRYNFMEFIGLEDPYAKLDSNIVLAEPCPFTQEFSTILPPPIGDFDPAAHVFINANTVVEMNHLLKFNRQPRLPAEWRREQLFAAAEHVARLMMIPEPIPFPTADDLIHVPFQGKKFAGIAYATMGLKTRAEAEPIAQGDAVRRFNRLMNGEYVHTGEVRIGGRGKLTTAEKLGSVDGGREIGRMILMMDHCDLKIAGVTENALTRAYIAPQYPVALGSSWWHGGCDDFLSRFTKFEMFYCLDAKKFDASIDPWMVKLALNILRRQFVDGADTKYDAYWNFVYEGLVECTIFRDDGLKFKKFVGTTSGHSHNTLVQSIITLIIGYATLLGVHRDKDAEFVLENSWIESLGDDNIIGVSKELSSVSCDDLAVEADSVYGIDWSGSKSFATTRLLDPVEGDFKGIQFLGKFFRLSMDSEIKGFDKFAIPYRPAEETYMRLYYPEKKGRDATSTLIRAYGNLYDCAGNTAMRAWMNEFIRWLEPQVVELPDEWPQDIGRWLTKAYSLGNQVELPPCKAVTYDEWLDLVTN